MPLARDLHQIVVVGVVLNRQRPQRIGNNLRSDAFNVAAKDHVLLTTIINQYNTNNAVSKYQLILNLCSRPCVVNEDALGGTRHAAFECALPELKLVQT